MRLSLFSLIVALVLTLTTRADAYHVFYVDNAGTAVPVRWQTLGNVFTADTDGPAGQNFTTLSTTATTTWNSVVDAQDVFGTPTTSLVNFTGTNINTAWGSLTGDGRYEFVYDADGTALAALGLDPASINGFGPSRQSLVGGQGVIDDAFFIVTGTRTNFDLLSTLIHELGHIQGLAHSSVGMHNSSTPDTALDKIALNSVPTMHPFSLGTGNTARRTLEPDDIAALREQYPEAGATTRWASIEGEVRRCGASEAVVGANVRLVNTANPNIQISRFTAYDGNSSGRYVVNYIPAGTYRVVVEPLGANGFTLNRFGSPPSTAENDFDFEYLSPPAVELDCAEEMPESGTANIATVTGSNGATSINNSFRVGAPDLAFVVDDTGSMGEEIGAVRSILSATINALQTTSTGRPFPRTAIVTFKDDVTRRIVSNNPANLQTVVNSLTASGGGDCPEASNAALLVAGRMLRMNGVALLFTDADSRADGPAASTVTDFYRAKGVRLFTLLSGTCTGAITPSTGTEARPTGDDVNSTQTTRGGSSNYEEYPAPPVNGSQPAVTTFSSISSNTGGFFVAITGINTGNPAEVTRYINTGTNLSLSAVFPAVALVTPTNAPQGGTLNVEVSGSNTNFIPGRSAVSFAGGGIAVNSVLVTSPTRLSVNVTVDNAATLGFRDIAVVTDLGGGIFEEAQGIGVLNITTAPTTPTTLSATPTQGSQGQTLDVTISAAAVAFTDASTASFGSGVTVLTNQRLNPTTLQARIQIAQSAAIGYRRVSVTTPGVGTAVDNSPAGAFQVIATAPVVPIIQSLTPNEVPIGQTATLNIVGLNTNFQPGATTLAFSGTGISVTSVTVTSATNLSAVISVAPSTTLGFRDVTATTGGENATILNGLRITPLTGDVNQDGTVNCTDLEIVIAASGTSSGQPGFDPRADVNGDGVINIRDVALVSRSLPAGTTCP